MRNKAKLGAIIGGIEGIIYSILFLLALEFYLPHPNPSKIVIFDTKSLFINLLSILSGVIPSALIGGFSTIVFSAILERFEFRKNQFIAICILFSIILILPANYLSFDSYYFGNIENSISLLRGDWHLFQSFLSLIAIIHIPSLIYITTTFFISSYLYNQRFSN